MTAKAPKPHPDFTAEEIEPCQYCSAPSEDIGIVEARAVRHGGPHATSMDAWVFCRKCKASGPIEISREAAIHSWNHGKEAKGS